MAVYMILDNEMIAMFEPLAPSRNIPNDNAPHSVSGANKQQAPQTLTMYNWLYGGHDEFNTVDN